MPVIEYLVMKRAAQWWVIRDGNRSGLFISQKAAIDASVGRAKMDFTAGNLAKVTVDEPEDGVSVVYDSSR